mmetsp:Transcript_7942/g.12888  ORF Transcript_7942/g.12888 Transcript_7942/m.12888 type:complete len:470 (-) Transcript_7942:668-2077(-)
MLKITIQMLKNGVLWVDSFSIQSCINQFLIMVHLFLTNDNSRKILIIFPSYFDYLFCFNVLGVLFKSFRKWLLVDTKSLSLLKAKKYLINFNTILETRLNHHPNIEEKLYEKKSSKISSVLQNINKNIWDTIRILINDSLKVLAFKGKFLFKISRLILQNLVNFRTILIFEPDLFILIELIGHLICKKIPYYSNNLYNIIILNFGQFRLKRDLHFNTNNRDLFKHGSIKQRYFKFFSYFRKNFNKLLINKKRSNFSNIKIKAHSFFKYTNYYPNIIEIQHASTTHHFLGGSFYEELCLFLSVISQYIILRLLGYKASDINLLVRRNVNGLKSKQVCRNILQSKTILKKPLIKNNLSFFRGKTIFFVIIDKGLFSKTNISLLAKMYYILSLHTKIAVLNDSYEKSSQIHKLKFKQNRFFKSYSKNFKLTTKINPIGLFLQAVFSTYDACNSALLNHLLFSYIFNNVILLS